MTLYLVPAVAIMALLSFNGQAWAGDSAQNERDLLRAAFANPPNRVRPLIITHSSVVDNPDIIGWLQHRRAGGAAIDAGITPGSENLNDEPWNNPTYLDDPARFEKLRNTMDRMREAGQVVWIYDELGYPSGSAGGRVVQGHPEYVVEVVGCRTFRGADGAAVEVDVRNEVRSCQALPERDSALVLEEAVDLTELARQGSFTWEAPEGTWAVCLFERWHPDTWRRHNIPRTNVNIMNRDAVARFIELTHERYARELGDRLAEVELFFTDEPQFGSVEPWISGLPESPPMVQWSPQLPEAFAERKGYPVDRLLPALFHDVGPETGRYRYDFYDVQSALVAENYFGQIQDWCHAHGVASSGHMLLEESLLFHLMWSGSMMRNWARMDLPGVDLLGASPYLTMGGWAGDAVPVPEDFSCKMASSVAHLLGKEGVFTESFAVAEGITLQRARGVAAWQFSGGITHMSTYTIQQQVSAEDYAAFSDYVGRLALLCRRGAPVADVAVLVPEASIWAAYNPPDGGLFPHYLKRNPDAVQIDRVFRDTCHALLENQREFECFTEELLADARLTDGAFEMGGMRFSSIILPEMRMIDPATLARVRAFVEAGGHAAFVGSLPSQNPARGVNPDMTDRARALLDDLPDRTFHAEDLDGLGDLVDWMKEAVPSGVYWDGSRSVRLLRRREDTREIVLLANPGLEPAAGRLAVPRAGRAAIWDPETGEAAHVGLVGKDDVVPVPIPAESARFVLIEQNG